MESIEEQNSNAHSTTKKRESGSQHPRFSMAKFRETLNRSVINLFTDFDLDNGDLPDSLNSAVFSKFFNCFHHCLEVFPEIFVSCPPDVCGSSKSDACNQVSDATDNYVATAFTEWLLMRMIRVLSEPSLSVLHEKCGDMLTSLLQVVRKKDPLNFGRLFLLLRNLLSDLMSFNEKLYNSSVSEEVFVIKQYFASEKTLNIEKSDELDLTDIPIAISDLSSCEYLQTKLTCIFNKLSFDLIYFQPDQCHDLLKLLCLQIELCDLDLRRESLNAVTSIIKAMGLPLSEQLVSYILDCLQALIQFCCSNQVPESYDQKSFEESVASCFEAVVKSIITSEMSFADHTFSLNSSLQLIMQTVISYGLSNVISKELQSSVGSGLFLLTSFLSFNNCPIPWNLLSQVRAVFIASFGRLEDHRCLSPFLIFLTILEVNKPHFVSNNAGRKAPCPVNFCKNTFPLYIPKCTAEMVDKPTHSRISDPTDRFPLHIKMKQSSTTWSSVLEFLQKVLSRNSPLNENKKDHVLVTNAVLTALEILLLSAFRNSNFESFNDIYILSPPGTSVDAGKSYLYPSILRSLHNYMIKLSTTPSVASAELFHELVTLANILVSSQDSLQLSDEQFGGLCSILSIPWLVDLVEDVVMDTHLVLFPVKSISYWKSFMSSEAAKCCLHGLSLLPKHIHQQWRIKILSLCLSSDDANTKFAAIQELPVFFYMFELPRSDIHDILRTITDDVVTMKTVSSIIGKLYCVLNSSCVLCRTVGTDGFLPMTPKLLCRICDGVDSSSQGLSSEGDAFLQTVLMKVLNHENVEVRKEAADGIPAYFAHSEINEDLVNRVIELVVDPDYSIRTKFRSFLKLILKPAGREQPLGWTSAMDEILVGKLKSSLSVAQSKKDIRLQETILQTIGELGKISKEGLLLICIMSLLENVLSGNPLILVVAQTQLKEISQAKGLRMYDLFRIYREHICDFLAEAVLKCDAKPVKIVEQMRVIFGFGDTKTFLNNAQRYILPYLVAKMAPNTSVLVRLLSSLLNVNRRVLLLDNFPYIFSHLVRHCSKSELEKVLTYVQKEAALEFGSLLRCNYQLVHNELLLHLGTHYSKIYGGLVTLALKNDQSEQGRVLTNHEEMAAYLQPKLLGLLVFFDFELLKSSITLDDKKLVLQSLIAVMKLMGPRYITMVRFKIMATLRIALRLKDSDFPKICCKTWKTFVHNVDAGSLGSILNQVIVSLLPLLEMEPAAVADIFGFLVIQNQSNLKDHFHDLYFIPDIPELEDINKILKEYVEGVSSQADFHSLLSHSLKGVSHENLDVRLHALEKVKQVLQTHQVAIHEHLLTRESADHLISHLVSVLLGGCRETDERARTLLGECLGELGAIDPGRLEIKSTSCTESLTRFYSSIREENFVHSIIQELVHSYLAAADCRTQDCSSFAIQELLRIYKCSDDSTATALGRRVWNRFPQDIQEILAVFLHTQYKPSEKDQDNFPKPIYKSKMGTNFKDWVTNWYSDLLHKVKEETAAELFHSCSIIAKYDINIAIFLMPYIVVYALLYGTESDSEEICNEVLAVLKHSGESNVSTQSDLCHLCSQTVFSVFDHLIKWIRHREQVLSSDVSVKGTAPKFGEDREYQKIKKFVSQIPQILLAKSSFSCQAYTRSLMHLEQHIRENPSDFKNNISFLQKMYAALDEPDGVAGVAAVRKEEPTLKDLMLEHESTGQMQDAFACYEKAVKIYPDEESYYCGLLKCYMGMDQPRAALTYANGLLKDRPNWKENVNAFRVEAAWKLTSWDDLETLLPNETNLKKWNVGLGKILFSSRKGDLLEFKDQINVVRNHQMAPLSAASMENGAYLRAYVYLSRLHMLTDLERGVKTFFELNSTDPTVTKQSYDISGILSGWKSRKQLVQSSLRYQEPILNLHRVLLLMTKEKHPELRSKVDHEIAHCWLQSAKLARRNGHQQRAYSCLLEASGFNSPALFMEKTKWHWNKGEKEQAINSLQKGIQEHFSDFLKGNNRVKDYTSEDQLLCAKAKLLLAMYSEESAITDSNSLIQMYRDVVSLQPRWEESHFHLAKYYDKMLNTIGKQESMAAARADIVVHVAKNFGNALKYGCKHIYHSLPRLLDLWFDMGTQVVDLSTAKRQPSSFKHLESSLTQLNSAVIPDLFERLPLFIFLTALPQMISRICHSHPDVTVQLQQIIAKLLATYRQQVIWMMMAVSKSSYPTRVQRCKKIFQLAINLKPELSKFIQDTTKLADKLIELSNKSVTDSNVLSINQQFQILPRLIEDKHFSPVMLPLQSQMLVTLPSQSGSISHHNPFPQTAVYIKSFQDTVEIFPSLQRPKKIIVRGTDGKLYGIICKPKDDLRKDCRLMEFNNLVNRYLKSDPEARKRQLYIRTYAVVPLNEECGLIEFVPNLSGFRNILNRIYKSKGLYVTAREIKSLMPPRTATVEQKMDVFVNKLLPRFAPVFSEWFLRTFPDPTAWYLARVSYARTTAVMSMVGYIVGLGDRHGENILFDASCGDTVHVDLNCLFNKGETMECPEVVPFRLTHNMVDAMGPTGFEGVFRKACEVTMRVMRSQTDALMSVLRPFVHDPLVEWSGTSRNSRNQIISGEIRNERGLTHVKDIEQRLNGLIKKKSQQQYLPLSIEGQVSYLIKEASDIRNLSVMYIGWAAYM